MIEWLREVVSHDASFDADEFIHFLFDDTDLATQPELEVGRTVYPDELKDLAGLTSVVDGLVSELGDVRGEIFLKAPAWGRVAEIAGKLLAKMEEAPPDTSSAVQGPMD